jgi:hypothetical protein
VHQRVTVDDAARWRQQRTRAVQRWFKRQRLGTAQQPQVIDAVGRALFHQPAEVWQVGRARCDHQLAAAPVRHALRAAVVVQQRLAAHAQLRLQAASGVVQPRVDDLAVARRDARADAVRRLDDDDLAPSQRQLARDRQADDAGADDGHFYLIHHCSVPRCPRACRSGWRDVGPARGAATAARAVRA